MPTIRITCFSCGKRLKIPDAAAGKRVKCPRCSDPVLVPLTSADAPRAAAQDQSSAVDHVATVSPAFDLPDGSGRRVPPVLLAAIGAAVAMPAVLVLTFAPGPQEIAATVPKVMTREVVREVVREVERQSPPPPSAPSADALYAQAAPAVVQVEVFDRQGRRTSRGTGFLVRKNGLIATNYHVVRDAHSAQVVLADKKILPVLGAVALNERADLAVIKADGEIKVDPLKLSLDEQPRIGTRVYAIGSPRGLTLSLSEGLVSGHREIGLVTHIQTTAPLSPGSSGGPLLGTDGQVLGVVRGGRTDGQNLNFAVTAFHVAMLLPPADAEWLTQFPLAREVARDERRPPPQPAPDLDPPERTAVPPNPNFRIAPPAVPQATGNSYAPQPDQRVANSAATAWPWAPPRGFKPSQSQRRAEYEYKQFGGVSFNVYQQAMWDRLRQIRESGQFNQMREPQ